MANNIVSANLTSNSNSFKINTVSVNKNVINAELMDHLIYKAKEQNGTSEHNISPALMVYNEYTLEELMADGSTQDAEVLDHEEKTLEELLASGKETRKELEELREAERLRLEAERKAKEEAERQAKLEAAKKEREKKEAELADLRAQLEANNGVFHPIIEADLEKKIKALEAELNVPHQPDGWEKFCDKAEDVGATAVTLVVSTAEGVVDVAETVVDGTVQVVGGAASYVVGAIDEEAGAKMQDDIKNFVAYDASGAMYDSFVEASGIDEDIAYGFAHSAGNFAGNVAGYAAISMIPGAGPVLTGAIGGMAAGGAAAEKAYANGATFDDAMVVTTTACAIGAVSGAATNQLGTVAKTATTGVDVLKYTGAGALSGMAEPLLNSGVEYATYGNNDGQSYLEYMDESGSWASVGMGALAGAVSTGSQAYKGRNELKSLEAKGYSVDSELEYKNKLKENGYDNKLGKRTEIVQERRSAYSNWSDECDELGKSENGKWALDNKQERFDKMGDASISLDADGTISADEFWKLKGNKDLRVENPTYGQKQMDNLENIRKSGEVDVYLPEGKYKDYKVAMSEANPNALEGRLDSDGHHRVYCTKYDGTGKSSGEMGVDLSTGWEDGQKMYRGKLNSSTVTYSSGLEASANPDWIPGGYTLNTTKPNGLGTPDLVLKDYKLDPKNYQLVN